MRQRCPTRDWLEYWAARLFLPTLARTPRRTAERLARFYSRLLDRVVPRLRRVALRNLEMALPEKSFAERQAITDGVFRSIARMMVAFARFPQINRANVGLWIRCEGYEHYMKGMEKGRGVLFATAHLGNWELSAFAHALLAGPMHIVVRPLDNRRLDALVTARRTHSGNNLLQKKDFARAILRALAANQAVGVLIDQNTSLDEGVFVDFFGISACTGAGFAKLAARTGAAVIPGFALWSDSEQRYVLRFYPPIAITGDAEEDTRRLHKQLESVIRQYPDQWLWIHRRWKTRPPGEPPLY